MQLFFQTHFPLLWVWHEWGRQTVLQSLDLHVSAERSQPLDPTGSCHCSVPIQRTKSCLQHWQEETKQSENERNVCHKHAHTWGSSGRSGWAPHQRHAWWGPFRAWRQKQWWLLLITRLTAHHTVWESPGHTLPLPQLELERAAPICLIPTLLVAVSP